MLAAAAGLLVCVCTIVLGQSVTNAEARSRVEKMLATPLVQPPPSGLMSVTDAVRDILSTSGTYGGIAKLDACVDRHGRIAYPTTAHSITLKEALDALVAVAPQYKWVLSDEGAINVLPVAQMPSRLLDTKIAYFDWDVSSPIFTAISYLSDAHEIRQRSLELNIIPYGHGGSYVSTYPRRPVEKRPDWRRVEHVSMLSALNAIAQSYGKGVWEYSECQDGHSSFMGVQAIAQ